jgi:hypothetical protein
MHLRTSLVQLFALLQLNFEEVVQIIELRRFGGAPNGYLFAALDKSLPNIKVRIVSARFFYVIRNREDYGENQLSTR